MCFSPDKVTFICGCNAYKWTYKYTSISVCHFLYYGFHINLQGKDSNIRIKQLESDITFHIAKHEAELALRVNSAAYHGDLYQLKGFIRAGADPNKTDYDGRSPLVCICFRNFQICTLIYFCTWSVFTKYTGLFGAGCIC